MPTQDKYGQGVDIASLTDAPNAEALAKAIVDALLERSILQFADAAERDATLTSPVDGMAAYLAAEQIVTARVAGKWVVIGASDSPWTKVSLTSGWSHNGNLNGDFEWRVVNMFGQKVIMFQGAIERASYPDPVPGSWTLTASPLPTWARPTTKKTITVPCSDLNSTRITLKMDVQTNGHLSLWGTYSEARPPWVGFNGCFTGL